MKKAWIVLLCTITATITAGCDQYAAKNFGGTMTIELEPNEKLEMITWKEGTLWHLTKPMTADDVPETHTFQADSLLDVAKGTVIIVESRE